MVMLDDMPKSKLKKSNESSWNLKKPDGWKTWNKAIGDTAQGMKVIDDSLSEKEVVKKFDAITKKAKFKAFGKSKPLTSKANTRRPEDRLKAAQGMDDKTRVKELLRKQYNTMEAEINKLKEGKLQMYSK